MDGTNVTLAVVPGVWDASAGTAPTYFTAQAAVDGNTNAAQVTITQNVPYFFMVGRRQLTATAIAKNTSIVAFSLGSGLASVDNGLLNQLLGYLLHTNLNIDAVSYQGLATTNIRLADLAVALGAGSMQELLSLSPSLGTFFNAVISVASQSGLAGVSVGGAGASNALSFGSDLNVPINIGDGGASSPGLLQVLALAGNEQAALNATVNVLDLLTTAAQIANSQSAVNVAPVVLNILGLGTVSLSLKIIEPPAIAVGPPGQFLSGPNAGAMANASADGASAVGSRHQCQRAGGCRYYVADRFAGRGRPGACEIDQLCRSSSELDSHHLSATPARFAVHCYRGGYGGKWRVELRIGRTGASRHSAWDWCSEY
ncbi:TadG family pilus assembly protein [Cupriavidus basilensis]